MGRGGGGGGDCQPGGKPGPGLVGGRTGSPTGDSLDREALPEALFLSILSRLCLLSARDNRVMECSPSIKGQHMGRGLFSFLVGVGVAL